MPRKNLSVIGIIKFLIESDTQFYEINDFSFDYSTKQILYHEKEFEPKLECIDFCLKSERNCNWQDFRDAVYYFARMNTPKPIDSQTVLEEYIQEWLEAKKPSRVSTLELIRQLFSDKPVVFTQRSLETRVGKALRNLGWKKSRTNSSRFWIPPEKCLVGDFGTKLDTDK
jgi:hypothetical protein